MTNEAGSQLKRATGPDLWMTLAAAAVAILMIVAATQVQAQTYTVLHSFAGTHDGSYPETGLTMDRAGNLYGTTISGGGGNCSYFGAGCGVVFRLAQSHSGWILTPLYSFAGSTDGEGPVGRVVFGPDGRLYGTTANGGVGNCDSIYGNSGCGTVFSLRPPSSACKTAVCPWIETVLYRFTGGADGGEPLGDIAFDQAGNLYGATLGGGNTNCPVGCGVVFKLAPSNGSWTESVIYKFTGSADGSNAWGGVAFDGMGNLYGTTAGGGHFAQGDCDEGCGAIWELTPNGSGWTETTLRTFQGSDGNFSVATLTVDQQGNLYGNTTSGGNNNGGVVFELTPSGGGWNFSLLQQILSNGIQGGSWAPLTIDSSGALLGTTKAGGLYGSGYVYKLTQSNGVWSFADLHDFYGGTDGGTSYSTVLTDTSGNRYGTAALGGAYGDGVVWMITP